MSEKLKLEYFKNENNFQSEIKNIFSFSKLLFFRYEKKKKKKFKLVQLMENQKEYKNILIECFCGKW